MDWKLLKAENYVATSWSGGTTTQLAIDPEGAVYADRDFLWRLSSATVELDHSDFTPLPDYNRFLAVLDGEIKLKIDAAEPFQLAPGRVVEFDGGVPVESWGRCVDFNLMVRKGKAQGSVTVLSNTHTCDGTWTPGAGDLAIYCASGMVRLPEYGLEARAGQLLLCRGAQDGRVDLVCEAGAVMLACVKEA
ncbi:MAG: HutD family protein [Lawsonibacter sp.]|nr:HutD family protein [Lawsonibacter sp.]